MKLSPGLKSLVVWGLLPEGWENKICQSTRKSTALIFLMAQKKTGPPLGTLLFSLAIALVLYKVMAVWAGFPNLEGFFNQFPEHTFLTILLLSITGNLLRFIAWQINLTQLGGRISVNKSLQYYLASFLFLPTPARAGVSVRAVYLKREKVPYSISAIALLLERLNDLFATALLSLLILGYVRPWLTLLMGAALGVVLIGLTMGKSHLTIPWAMIRRWVLKCPIKKIKFFIIQLETVFTQQDLRIRRRPLMRAQVLVCLAFGLYGLGLYTALIGLGAQISPYQVIGIYTLSTVISSFSFIPTGLGGAEAAMLFFLSVLNINHQDCVSAILLSRLGSIWFLVGLGALATLSIQLKALARRA